MSRNATENEKIEQWIDEHGQANWKEIAEYLGKPKNDAEKLRSKYKAFRKRRGDFKQKEEKYRATFQMGGDGTVTSDRLIEMSEEDSKTPRRVIELHGFDPDEWELIDVINNYWQMMKSQEIGGGSHTLYQSKIRLKPRDPNEITLKEIDSFFDNYVPKKLAPPRKAQYKPGDLLEINLGDLHIDGDGDIEERVEKILEQIETKAQFYQFSQIVLVLLGDVFHYDSVAQTTTGGTKIESTGLGYCKMFDTGLGVALNAIQRLSRFAPVKVPYVPGNHDESYLYMLIKALEGRFIQDEMVTFDCGHDPWKGHMHGKNLIVWQHGDIAKARLKTLPQTEFREEWGEAEWVELHAGHLHHEQVYEDGGVTIRHLPAVSGQSRWEKRNGYTGSRRGTVCYVWDKDSVYLESWTIRL